MAKGLKLRMSFLSSLQICRPKNPASSVKDRVSAVTYILSPVNSKSFDIPYPGYPNPPPSTPYQSKSRSNIGASKIAPFESEYQSKPCTMHGMIDDEYSLPVFSKTRREGKEKMYNSPISSDFEESACSNAVSRTQKRKEKTKEKKTTASIITTTASVNYNETDSLFSFPQGSNSSHKYDYLLQNNIEKEPLNRRKKQITQKTVRARRFRRFGSKEWKNDERTVPIGESMEKIVTSQRMVLGMTTGKINQSFVVVKRSVDPFEDFKTSMLEMILDKQIFRPKELEELLMSFLSLNSRLYHEVIVEAFTDIWKEVYGGSWN
ncbi:hypothetical protein F511_01045 [Dorcoceras hygrometricum]|uniref:Transcription repressor n=1 Tax=Dorcoceras hygrometricum TaxID=472368 RepID=A0A2Z7AEY4_9LAMI|nr:hypothetical protein F511_01045 [Dorcoceras hygrometricum]